MKCPYCEKKQSVFKFSNICSNCKKKYKPKILGLKFFLIMFSVMFLANILLALGFGIKSGAILKGLIAGTAAAVASRYATTFRMVETLSEATDAKNMADDVQTYKSATPIIKSPEVDYDNEVSTWDGRE